MTKDEKYDLLIEMRKKEIKSKDVATHLGCSASLISLFLNNKANMSAEKVAKMKHFIESKPVYRMVRVEIK